MSVFKPARHMSGLLGEILAAAGARDAYPASSRADQYFSELSRLDYTFLLPQRFDQLQVRGLIAELKRYLPELNRRVFSETNLDRLAAIAIGLGADLERRAFGGHQGVSLRGFYVNDEAVVSRPLIVVNTANDPIGVAATFWHEVGHHLTHKIFG